MTRTLTTTAALAALAWLPPSTGAAAAQETTAQDALEQLQQGERVNGVSARGPALRILRQVDERGDPAPRTAAELDAFADQAAAIAADSSLPDDVRWEAFRALRVSTREGMDGTPYPRARVFDLLVEVYESGYGPALDDIWEMDPERGPAYVRELFERSEPPALLCRWVQVDGEWQAFIGGSYLPAPLPPECDDHYWRDDHKTPFCRAGSYLFQGIVEAAWERTPGGKRGGAYGPGPVPPGLPEEVEDWHRRCR